MLRQIAQAEEHLFLLRARLDQLHREQRKMITISRPPSAPLTPVSGSGGASEAVEAAKAAVSLPARRL